jgi:SAM-dependent methyltransferase
VGTVSAGSTAPARNLVRLRENYAPGWADDAVGMMARRTARERAAFFLPLLEPGMRVLDVGCGPGSITVGLAKTVGPQGEVVGVDMEPSQVAMARIAAEREQLANARFEVASIYALPFTDASFDAIFAHAVLEHLARPEAGLAELRRLLRTGGALGIADSNWREAVVEPRTPDVDLALASHFNLRREAGGDPFAGERVPALIKAAGFTDIAVTECDRADTSYDDLARYVSARIEAALQDAEGSTQTELRQAATAARRWTSQRAGHFSQRWVLVTGRG